MLNPKVVRNCLFAMCAIALTSGPVAAGATKIASLAPNTDLSRRTVSIGADRGGVLIQYGLRMLRWRANRTRVRFNGRCQSACTLFLGLAASQVCISPGASFSFHLPYGSSPRGNRIARDFMMRNYPGWVRSWILSQGGLGSGMKTMAYGYASRFIKPCGSRFAAGP